MKPRQTSVPRLPTLPPNPISLFDKQYPQRQSLFLSHRLPPVPPFSRTTAWKEVSGRAGAERTSDISKNRSHLCSSSQALLLLLEPSILRNPIEYREHPCHLLEPSLARSKESGENIPSPSCEEHSLSRGKGSIQSRAKARGLSSPYTFLDESSWASGNSRFGAHQSTRPLNVRGGDWCDWFGEFAPVRGRQTTPVAGAVVQVGGLVATQNELVGEREWRLGLV